MLACAEALIIKLMVCRRKRKGKGKGKGKRRREHSGGRWGDVDWWRIGHWTGASRRGAGLSPILVMPHASVNRSPSCLDGASLEGGLTRNDIYTCSGRQDHGASGAPIAKVTVHTIRVALVLMTVEKLLVHRR